MAEPRKTRPVSWVKAALKEFEIFPEGARSICLTALTIAAEGGKADIVKPMQGLGSGVFEIALPLNGDAFRVVYVVQLADDIWVVHTFQKKSTQGIKTPKHEIDLIKDRIKATEGDVEMKRQEKLEVARGSGNVFRDLGHENADAEQFKAILAAEIIKALDRDGLTVRAAHSRTGIAAADFSRIRNADLGRFTLHRLMAILNRLGSRIEIKVRVRRQRAALTSSSPPAQG
jgi:phage-related protein/predicted XRE-type DNA-binding protein